MKFKSIKDIENFIPKKGSFKHYLRKVQEDGRIVKGVNTTTDVGVNQIPIEVEKFGSKVDIGGNPPTLSTKIKGKSTNVLFNLGLAESKVDISAESMLYLKQMKEELGEISQTTKIYVDMDGVLADFFGAWAKLMGKSNYRDIKDIQAGLQKIKDTDDFWLRLPLTKNAYNLLSLIAQVKGEYSILSSPLPGDPNSEPHKRQWIKKNLSNFLPKDIIITHDKAKYAKNDDGTSNILIDDYGVNITKWEAAGGIGFKHKDHKFERTAKSIKKKVSAQEGAAIPNPKNTFLTKSDTAYDFIRVGKTISNLKDAPKDGNRDEPDVMIVPYGGKKEKDHLKKGLKRVGYKTQDADKDGDDAHVDESSVTENFAEPQFDIEWEEANRYPFLDKLGKDGWIELAQTGKVANVNSNIVKKIGNTGADGSETLADLEPEKVERLKKAMKSGTIEMPIVMKMPNGKLELIAGNTRLIGLISTEGKAKVWYIDASKLDENFADGKKKGKSKPGRVKKSGASCNGSVTKLRKQAKNASGEKAKMYHWCANMKSGRKKK